MIFHYMPYGNLNWFILKVTTSVPSTDITEAIKTNLSFSKLLRNRMKNITSRLDDEHMSLYVFLFICGYKEPNIHFAAALVCFVNVQLVRMPELKDHPLLMSLWRQSENCILCIDLKSAVYNRRTSLTQNTSSGKSPLNGTQIPFCNVFK